MLQQQENHEPLPKKLVSSTEKKSVSVTDFFRLRKPILFDDREPTQDYDFDYSSDFEYFGDSEDNNDDDNNDDDNNDDDNNDDDEDNNSISKNIHDNNHINGFCFDADVFNNDSDSIESSNDGYEDDYQSFDTSSAGEEYYDCGRSSEDDHFYSSESEEDSDSSQSGPNFETEHLNDPLYDNAPLTVGESVLCILTFMIRHKVTRALLSDLLSLISLHCIQPNLCIKTLYYFDKFFKNIRSPIRRHFFCSACFFKLENQKSSCPKCNVNQEVVLIDVKLIIKI
ncbi:Protein of unknown function [Cotesia congregata]|uniref:Uncharacterized protein n=1 Tax=Cotesia congregata TaxID=51543 RepID=A0A8J2HHB1_COTCN|nr:Protein of unknown function [Cotesia congregata]